MDLCVTCAVECAASSVLGLTVRGRHSIEPLSEESKAILIKMMEQLSEAHYQAAQVAQSLADLAKTCSPAQTMTIMKFAVRPLV